MEQLVFPTALLSISPNTGKPGQEVYLTGSGFGTSESVTLYANSTAAHPIGKVVADKTGGFFLDFHVPPAPAGNSALVGVGKTSGRVGVAAFYTNSVLTVTPASGPPGSTAVVKGYGLSADAPLDLYWSNTGVVLARPNADDRGSFSVLITIPIDSAVGTNIISVAYFGGGGAAARASFNVQ